MCVHVCTFCIIVTHVCDVCMRMYAYICIHMSAWILRASGYTSAHAHLPHTRRKRHAHAHAHAHRHRHIHRYLPALYSALHEVHQGKLQRERERERERIASLLRGHAGTPCCKWCVNMYVWTVSIDCMYDLHVWCVCMVCNCDVYDVYDVHVWMYVRT